MTPALACQAESFLFQDGDDFFVLESAGAFRSYGNFHGRQIDELRLGDLLAGLDTVIDVKVNGIPDIVQHLLIGFPLCVTSLELRAECRISLLIFLNHDRKPEIVHARFPHADDLLNISLYPGAITF